MRHILIRVLIVIALTTMFSTVSAQAGVLVSGSGQLGLLTDQTPLTIYSFNGNVGDQVTVRVLSLTPGMTTSLSLLGPNQQQIASSDSDAFSENAGAARVTARLTAAGAHSVLVGGTPGDYLITFNSRPPVETQTIAPVAPITVTLSALTPMQTLSFAANPTTASSLSLRTEVSEAGYSARMYDGEGQLSGVTSGLQEACLGVRPGNGTYEVIVETQERDLTFDVVVTYRNSPCVGASSGGGTTSNNTSNNTFQPVATPEIVAPEGVCLAVAGGTVNIRSGAGTNFGVVGTLNAGQSITVTGTSGTGWYAVQSQSVQGWIAASVVNVTGACANLPQVGSPAPDGGQPTQPAQQTPTVTLVQGQPTATQAATQPDQPTATFTLTQVFEQIAPQDSNYVLNAPLDQTVTLSDVVSYPNGDTEDRVSYNVTGLNNNVALPGGRAQLVITATCTGTNPEQIQFRGDGQNATCGQNVINREVNADSDTGGVQITAVGGTGTYVQWTLTATVTRLN